MAAKEAKEIEDLQSINDNTQVLGYDKAGNKSTVKLKIKQ